MGIIRDVTERKNLEEQLRQAIEDGGGRTLAGCVAMILSIWSGHMGFTPASPVD
jgi:hypothetical protein